MEKLIQNFERWRNNGQPIWVWTVPRIAEFCGVSRTTARRWLSPGGKWERHSHIVSGGPLRPRYGLDREVIISLLSEERGEKRRPDDGRAKLIERLSRMIA